MFWVLLFFLAGDFETTFHEGLIALNQNNLSVAEGKLRDAASLQPRNARVWLALAQTDWKLHKETDASAAAENAAKWAGDDAIVLQALPVFYFEVAEANLKQENFAAALAAAETGRRKFDRNPQLALAAGVAYYGLRRFPEAIDAFLRTLELDPSVEQPYVFLGRMLDQAEDRLPRITEAFAAFAKRAPADYRSAFLYGKALAMANEPQHAEPLLRTSIGLNDGYWESHFELGVLLAQQRKWEDAARELRRSAELSPNDPAPHYHLARVYDRLGKTAEAAAERAEHARLTAAARPASGMEAGIK